MRILIAEDDMLCRKFLYNILSVYGECIMAANGLEALDAFLLSIKNKKPFQLVCLDIMMPKINGVKALKSIRDIEIQNGVIPEKRAKVLITTALAETKLVKDAFDYGCDAYLPKPVETDKLIEVIQKLGLID